MKAGVLALQGDFREHARVFADLGASPMEVRVPADLTGVDVLAIPGGESTTISKLAQAPRSSSRSSSARTRGCRSSAPARG